MPPVTLALADPSHVESDDTLMYVKDVLNKAGSVMVITEVAIQLLESVSVTL